MTTKIIYNPTGASPYTTSTAAKFTLGDRAFGSEQSEFLYVKASAAIPAYKAAFIDSAFAAVSANVTNTSTLAGYIGWPQVAVANAEYAWVQVKGPGLALSVSSNAGLGAQQGITDAGQLSDSANTSIATPVSGVSQVANTGSVNTSMSAVFTAPSLRD